MNIDDVIRAHAGWKTSLRRFANGSTLDYADPKTAAMPDRCALGQWLGAEGKAELADDEKLFQNLSAVHATFHQHAGAIADLVTARQTASALSQLDDPGSDFSRASMKVVSLLMVLKQKLRDREAGR